MTMTWSRTPSIEVQQLFVAAQREPNGVRWVFALALGLRQGEALGLQWGDVDWSRSVLTIKRSRTRPRYEHRCQPHCGHKYAGHCPNRVLSRPDFDTTKSRAGRRVVPLPAAVLDLLRDHAKLRRSRDGRPLSCGLTKVDLQ